ncbi:MAG: HD domain-containing protein [Lactobacillaceae bacterium]|jgi:HD superfamily phosphohydrolase|nr:HD domain-containing protein [Lactobacillaceae bacterium]
MVETVFRDPVHNFIRVQDQTILDLIGTREFQRLRRIKQLGVAGMVFHGAEHSRFSHSLGVYEIARQFAVHLAENYATEAPNDGGWDPNERLVLLAAALLHDLGHGPYSHTFEHIFKTNHELYTQKIILSPETEVNQVLRRVSRDFPEKVASVIAKTYPNQQVVQMISSQIDADRMDYLLRDAYYSGATYGTFDLFRIIHMMRPYEGGIAFHEKGMASVEDYVVSRYQMYAQVYFHPVSRGFEVLLTHMLQRARELYERSKFDTMLDDSFISPTLKPLFDGTVNLQDYLELDDSTMLANISLWRHANDPVLADLAMRFLDRRRLKSVEIDDDVRQLLPTITELIAAAGYDPNYYTAENDSFDLPYDAYNPTAKKPRTQIEMMQDDGTLRELSDESTLINALTGREFGNARYFFPREMLLQHAVDDVMAPVYADFQQYVHNDKLVLPKAP